MAVKIGQDVYYVHPALGIVPAKIVRLFPPDPKSGEQDATLCAFIYGYHQPVEEIPRAKFGYLDKQYFVSMPEAKVKPKDETPPEEVDLTAFTGGATIESAEAEAEPEKAKKRAK
jgi:hypothetical protein